MRLEDGELVFYDAAMGERLLTEAEAEHAAGAAAEAELRKLRAQVRREGEAGN